MYFGMKLNSAKGAREKKIVDYALQVLGKSISLSRFLLHLPTPLCSCWGGFIAKL